MNFGNFQSGLFPPTVDPQALLIFGRFNVILDLPTNITVSFHVWELEFLRLTWHNFLIRLVITRL